MVDAIPFKTAGFVQFQIKPGDPAGNIKTITSLIEERKHLEPNALLVLPEMWAVGFEYSRTEELAEKTPEVLQVLQKIASKYDVYIGGSLPELMLGDNRPQNSLFLVGKEGVVGSIPKQYMFSHWKEDRFFAAGNNCHPIDVCGGKVGGMVCYDLRFPEVAREQAYEGARLIMVSAQWPKARCDHWQALLKARAIENQVFIVAANGCGLVGEVELGGSSMIISPSGDVLALADDQPSITSVSLDENVQKNVRKIFCPPGEKPWRKNDERKILSKELVKNKIDGIRQQGATVAFTNGCFDILHAGHVSYLERARETSDCLILGLNSDSSIRRIKGEGRPVNNEKDRARVLAALGCVDYIVLFEDDTPFELITYFLPDVLVKGADWAEGDIVGAREVKDAGGRVARIVFEYERSTTDLIEKIQQETCLKKVVV